MDKHSFTVYYNGKNVSVCALEDNTYMFQITYKPVYLKQLLNTNGGNTWCEVEINRETSLSKEIGELIEDHLSLSK